MVVVCSNGLGKADITEKPGLNQSDKPKRNLNSPAMKQLRKKVVYHDPDQWKKDIQTGDSEL